MQPGSLNAKFLTKGAAVKAGEFLGLAGNAGASSGPHLHIHANKTIANDPKSWDNVPRPMVMRGARVVAWPFVNGNPSASPWVTLNKRGIPPTDCAVWPADSPVVKLRYARCGTWRSVTPDSYGSCAPTTAFEPRTTVFR